MQFIDQPAGFVVAVLVFQLVPGPGTLTILRATASQGLQAGFASVAGTLLGGLVCMLAAASGLEAVFRGQPQATLCLKWAGLSGSKPASADSIFGMPSKSAPAFPKRDAPSATDPREPTIDLDRLERS